MKILGKQQRGFKKFWVWQVSFQVWKCHTSVNSLTKCIHSAAQPQTWSLSHYQTLQLLKTLINNITNLQSVIDNSLDLKKSWQEIIL